MCETFSPKLKEILQEYAGTEWDDLDPQPDEGWDPEYTVYNVPLNLQEPVLAELERLNGCRADAVREALSAPGSVLRLHDYFEDNLGYADLGAPIVEQRATASNGESILYDPRYADVSCAGRKKGKRINWTNHLRGLVRRFHPKSEIPVLADFGGDMQKYRGVLVELYRDIPWRPAVSVFACLGGRNQRRDAPD